MITFDDTLYTPYKLYVLELSVLYTAYSGFELITKMSTDTDPNIIEVYISYKSYR